MPELAYPIAQRPARSTACATTASTSVMLSEDIHLTRTRKTFTLAGWKRVSETMLALLDDLDQIVDEETARLEAEPDLEKVEQPS